MLTVNKGKQTKVELVMLEQLVPEDHLLRKIDEHINFDFIYDIVSDKYCLDNGRPSIDPVVLFKMLFIGYLYGIRSERRLSSEIQVNMAYRWFLGLDITENVPDSSTISQNRRRRFKGTDIPQQIFDNIVQQAIDKGLVSGKTLFSDSTFLKANASRSKFTMEEVTESIKEYIHELDEDVNRERINRNKKLLKKKELPKKVKVIRRSKTDPESGYMSRPGKPEGFFYLDHRTVDGKCNIITDVHVTPGNVHDSMPYIERLEAQIEKFGFKVEEVALDSGYMTAPIAKKLHDKGIFSVIAYRSFRPTKQNISKYQFKYDEEKDVYICPEKQELKYKLTNREGYHHYQSNPEICSKCPRLSECTRSQNHVKVITRHVWESHREWIRENRISEAGKKLYARRKETIERSFADSKELHGLRYCRMRGIEKVREQCLLTAAAQNMKKIAMMLSRKN